MDCCMCNRWMVPPPRVKLFILISQAQTNHTRTEVVLTVARLQVTVDDGYHGLLV